MTRAEYRAALRGRRCYVGMDLSSTKDLTALVAVFPDESTDMFRNVISAADAIRASVETGEPPSESRGFDVLAQFFVPQDNIRERANRDRVPYDQWAREGHLIATPGNVVDYEAVRRTLQDWGAEFDLRELAFDPWNATDLVTRLQEQDGFTCVPMRQGFGSLSAPTKSLEKAILSRTLRHDGHPVLRWCISNISVESDAAGNLKLSKKVSTERIDGASALVMGIDRMDRNNSVKPPAFQMLVLGGGK